MDAALLACSDTDGLSVFHIAYRVTLCVLQCDEGDNQVALSLWRKGLVLCRHVLEERIVVELDLVASLLEGDAEYLLALDGLRLVGGIDLDDVIGTLALVLQDLDGLRCEVGSYHAVAHLALQQLGCRGVAGVAQGYEVTIARHTVCTARSGIGTCDGTLVETLHIVYEVDLLQCVAQGQAYGSASRTDVLERGCSSQASSGLQFLHQLPGIKSVEEIDVARTTVNHFDG